VVSQCGRVVPPGDPQGLAKAILKLVNDPQQCEELGRAARLYAEQFLSRQGVMAHLNRSLAHCVAPGQDPQFDPMNP
jgi:colanic acid biosynthesis glycosyl transferase WcaI